MKAPFTPQQVEALNRWQKGGFFHPFTCPNDGSDLVATEPGWTCPKCDYTQDWAHDFMAQDSMIGPPIGVPVKPKT